MPLRACHSTAPTVGVGELSGHLCPEEKRWGVEPERRGPGAPQVEMRIRPVFGCHVFGAGASKGPLITECSRWGPSCVVCEFAHLTGLLKRRPF